MAIDYRLAIAAAAIIILFLLGGIFAFTALIALTIAVSLLAEKTSFKKFGLEFVTFTTVIAGFTYGAAFGFITGILLVIIHEMTTHRISGFLFYVVPVFGIVGALASIFSNVNILFLGMGLTLFSHAIFILGRTLTSRFPVAYIPYFLINVAINFVLFSTFANPMLSTL
jgi:hypothetical protein